ncbi:MAG TPA: VWA domain-containing protein [Thermoanaerobaculia bacterium]|nr:VWA domain-containing protein [Thermoanaerobaculia bacterium]
MSADDLIVHLARFAGALRDRKVPVSLSDEVDAAAALTLVDLSDREEVRRALRIALKVRRRDAETFDSLFDLLWGNRRDEPAPVDPAARRSPDRAVAARRRGKAPTAPEEEIERERAVPDSDEPGYSPEALLRRKPFDECSPADLAAMEKLLARLALRLATRRSRRLVPTRGRGFVDPRRSLRRALATEGELLRFARRARAVEEPRIVVLCDTSGSMDAHTRFLLAFLLALAKVARKTEIFAFNTALTRLTPWLAAGRVERALERLAAGVPDWSGGTRIGECLAEFVESHGEMLDVKTVVVIVSDGLDRGDTAVLSRAMRDIRSRARRVIWLNPLLGDPRYEPTARGMAAALPFVDLLAPAHNFESLERLLPELAA